MKQSPRAERIVYILKSAFIATLTLVTVGCAGGTGNRQQTLAEVTLAYDEGRYQDSYEGARDLARASRPPTSEQASYIAGLSAYQLKRYTDALRHLQPLTASKDQFILGHASATLGMVQIEQNQPKEAISPLKKAITLLEGEDLAEAEFHLGKAYQLTGDATNARSHFLVSKRLTSNASLRSKIDDELARAGYALQIGAYGSLANAKSAADTYDRSGKGAGLGAARIVQSKDRFGRMLYLVQVGYFANLEAAQRARSRIGSTAIITQNTALPGQ